MARRNPPLSFPALIYPLGCARRRGIRAASARAGVQSSPARKSTYSAWQPSPRPGRCGARYRLGFLSQTHRFAGLAVCSRCPVRCGYGLSFASSARPRPGPACGIVLSQRTGPLADRWPGTGQSGGVSTILITSTLPIWICLAAAASSSCSPPRGPAWARRHWRRWFLSPSPLERFERGIRQSWSCVLSLISRKSWQCWGKMHESECIPQH